MTLKEQCFRRAIPTTSLFSILTLPYNESITRKDHYFFLVTVVKLGDVCCVFKKFLIPFLAHLERLPRAKEVGFFSFSRVDV